LIFDLLFWDRSFSLDPPIFILVTCAILLQRFTWRGHSLHAKVAMGGAVLSGAMVHV